MPNRMHVCSAAVSRMPRVRYGSGGVRLAAWYPPSSKEVRLTSTSTIGPCCSMRPTTREYSCSSAMIGQHRPWHADHPVLRQDLLDEKAPADGTAIASCTRLVLVVEATHELRSTATITRLHEDRPASLICREQFKTVLLKGSRQLVEDRIWVHAALWHDNRLPRWITSIIFAVSRRAS